MSLRVGIAGAGQAGDHHAIGFAATEGAEVVAIADLNQELARSVAERYGARAVSDWRSLLELEIDILVVALPHNLHLEPAEAAAERGIHVLMEKPIAISLADGRRIVEVCERAGVKLTISFVHRYREELQLARSWIDAGEIGTPMVARETMGSQRGPHLGDWVERSREAGGGVLMYSAIHGIDRLLWLLGSEVACVDARTRRFDPESEIESSVTALLSFTGGAVGMGHGPDYVVRDYEQAVIRPAKAMAMAAIDLLANGATKALEVLAKNSPPLTKQAYLNLQDSRLNDELYEGR